jgi:hypothetical protein
MGPDRCKSTEPGECQAFPTEYTTNLRFCAQTFSRIP